MIWEYSGSLKKVFTEAPENRASFLPDINSYLKMSLNPLGVFLLLDPTFLLSLHVTQLYSLKPSNSHRPNQLWPLPLRKLFYLIIWYVQLHFFYYTQKFIALLMFVE